MIRNALLLCAALLTAATFACQQVPPGQPQVRSYGPIPFTSRTCSANDLGDPNNPNDPGSFAANVVILAPNFDPSKFGAPLLSTSQTPLSAQMQGDLKAAFMAAPPSFRTALCGLTAVYIDPTNPFSWGYRDPGTPSNRYIGLSQQSLWGAGGTTSPPVYSLFETNSLAQVMAQLGMPWPPSPPPPAQPLPNAPAFSSASPIDAPAMTVLAVLAHEFGHVFWYDQVKKSDNQYDPTQFCHFFDKSWATVTRPNPWVPFAYPSGDLHARGLVQLAQLQDALTSTPPNFTRAARLLNFLYGNERNATSGIWASLFATISPEEDFVETFKIYIMTRDDSNGFQPLMSMPLNIYSQPGSQPTYRPDIYADLYSNGTNHAKGELTRKITCIDSAFSSVFPTALRYRR